MWRNLDLFGIHGVRRLEGKLLILARRGIVEITVLFKSRNKRPQIRIELLYGLLK